MMDLVEIARAVVGAKVSRLSETDRAAARRHIFDTAVGLVAGLHIAEGRALLALAKGAAFPDLVGILSAMTRLTEIDDIHLRSCTTPSSIAVPVALALAEREKLQDFDAVWSAVWVGTELIARLGEALSGPQILYRGVWPTYLVAPFGAAAVAARLLHLEEKAAAHALSLALMLGSGAIGQFRGTPSGRWFLFATAVALGIGAAFAARDGYMGDLALLDGDWFGKTHGLSFDRQAMRLPSGGGSIYSELSLKPYCSSKQSIAAVEGLKEILASGVVADAISRVVVQVPPPYTNMIRMKAVSGVRSSTLVSVAHQLALAAYEPSALFDIDRSRPIADERVVQFADKVEVVEDASLSALYPSVWPATVAVTAEGRVVTRSVTVAPGDPGRSLSDDDVARKAERVLQHGMERSAIDDWLGLVRSMWDESRVRHAFMEAVLQEVKRMER